MGLTIEQVDTIKATVPVVKEHGNTITTVFYKNLLTDVPDLNNIFNTANQVNGHQATALANALYAYAANIDNLSALGPFVERVCMKHASLYITRDQYDIVGTYLLAAMKQILGDALTPDIHDAWSAAYNQLANLMANREEQLITTDPTWTTWRSFRISRKIPESKEITSFYLVPVDNQPLPPFHPGQYISIQTSVPTLNYNQARQYSLSDRPRPDYYRISVKKESGLNPHDPNATAHPGYISNILHDVKNVGDILQVSHPYGDFYLDANTDPNSSTSTSPLILLSAGVGITPMISIVNSLLLPPSTSPQSTRQIHLIHSTRSTPLHPFRTHIQNLASMYPDAFRYTFFNKNPSSTSSSTSTSPDIPGGMDLSKIPNLVPVKDADAKANANAIYMICGPTSFMHDMRDQVVREYGVERSRVRLEVFGTGGID